MQGTYEESGKLDNRAPPFRVLEGWPRSGRVGSSTAQGTCEANRQNMPGKNEENGKQAGSPAGNTATAVRGQVKEIGGPWPPGFHPLPFQALRASFPEGKPTHVRFEAHVGLTDQRNLGQLTQSA